MDIQYLARNFKSDDIGGLRTIEEGHAQKERGAVILLSCRDREWDAAQLAHSSFSPMRLYSMSSIHSVALRGFFWKRFPLEVPTQVLS